MPDSRIKPCGCACLLALLLTVFRSGIFAGETALPPAGTFTNDRMVVDIEPGPAGGYAGSIQFKGKTFPLAAHDQDGKLIGTFSDTDGNSFDFTAAFDGTTLLLTTGDVTHRLTLRQPEPDQSPPGSSKLPWLHPGAVVTWTWFGMQAAGTERDYREDDHGFLINPTTGQRFDASERRGTSAGGFTQVAVAAVDGDTVAFTRSSFTDMRLFGIKDPSPLGETSGDVVPLANTHLGDAWIDPAKLAAMQSVPAQHFEVAYVPWKAGDQTVDAIHIILITDKSCSDYVYDRRRGLLLHYFTSSQGPPPRYIGPGEAGQGDTYVFRGDFVAMRDAAIPWAQEPLPDWLLQAKSFRYQGTTAFVVKSVLRLPQRQMPLTSDISAVAHGANWIELAESTTVQGSPVPTRKKLICGPASIAGLWAGPIALGKLTEGQVLDEDPLSRVRTVVDQVSDDAVVISVGNAGASFTAEYDKHTGMRRALSWKTTIPRAQGSMRLENRD